MGKWSSRALGATQPLFFIVVMGGHSVKFSTMMNVLTEHSNCTALYAFVGVLISFCLTLPRRIQRLSHLSLISFISILGAVLVSMIGVSWNRDSPGLSGFSPTPTVHDACIAIATIVFAYASHVAFFTLFAELRYTRGSPKAFKAPRGLALLQPCEILSYALSATVVYAYVGNVVISPALRSAGMLFRMISFKIEVPRVCID